MGCDIHAFIEYSRDGGKTWFADENHHHDTEDEYIDSVTVCGRDYSLFGWLAGVRSRDEGLYGPNKLPDDLSPTVAKAIEYWDADGHSHNCLSLREFTECLKHSYEYDLKTFNKAMKDAEPIAFFNWRGSDPDARRSMWTLSYVNMLKYCEYKLADMAGEHMLLADPNIPRCRIVFFFDN